MVRHSMLVVALSLLGSLLAAPALADLAPPDACAAADAGKACSNATKDGKLDQPGTCQKATCTRAAPTGSVSYDCYRCDAANPPSDTKPTSTTKANGGGCSTSGHTGNAASALLPLLALAVLRSHRRRARTV